MALADGFVTGTSGKVEEKYKIDVSRQKTEKKVPGIVQVPLKNSNVLVVLQFCVVSGMFVFSDGTLHARSRNILGFPQHRRDLSDVMMMMMTRGITPGQLPSGQ